THEPDDEDGPPDVTWDEAARDWDQQQPKGDKGQRKQSAKTPGTDGSEAVLEDGPVIDLSLEIQPLESGLCRFRIPALRTPHLCELFEGLGFEFTGGHARRVLVLGLKPRHSTRECRVLIDVTCVPELRPEPPHGVSKG